MGDVELASPLTHISISKSMPSRLGCLLDVAQKSLERIIFLSTHIITHRSNDQRRHEVLPAARGEASRPRSHDVEKGDAYRRIRTARATRVKTEAAEIEAHSARRTTESGPRRTKLPTQKSIAVVHGAPRRRGRVRRDGDSDDIP